LGIGSLGGGSFGGEGLEAFFFFLFSLMGEEKRKEEESVRCNGLVGDHGEGRTEVVIIDFG
jgi:hypothetical protein